MDDLRADPDFGALERMFQGKPRPVTDLERRRLCAGLTQRQMARLLGYSQMWVSLLERGRWPISDEVRLRWEAACGRHE